MIMRHVSSVSYIINDCPSVYFLRPLDIMLLIHKFEPDDYVQYITDYAHRLSLVVGVNRRYSPTKRKYIFRFAFGAPCTYNTYQDIAFTDAVLNFTVFNKTDDVSVARLKFERFLADYFLSYYISNIR